MSDKTKGTPDVKSGEKTRPTQTSQANSRFTNVDPNLGNDGNNKKNKNKNKGGNKPQSD
jgi:hypothetical protein